MLVRADRMRTHSSLCVRATNSSTWAHGVWSPLVLTRSIQSHLGTAQHPAGFFVGHCCEVLCLPRPISPTAASAAIEESDSFEHSSDADDSLGGGVGIGGPGRGGNALQLSDSFLSEDNEPSPQATPMSAKRGSSLVRPSPADVDALATTSKCARRSTMYYGAGLGPCCLCTCTFTPLPTSCCMHATARCAPHAHACHCCPAVACGPTHAPLCQHASTTTGPVLHLCTAACPRTRISVHTLPVCTTTMCSDREVDSG